MNCKNILVVGNAKSLLERENGHKIDTFDYVVRMGNCPLKGYEKYVGTKTDMYRASWDRLIHVDKQKLTYRPIFIQFQFSDLLFLETHLDEYIETTPLGNYSRFVKVYKKSFFPLVSFFTPKFIQQPQRFLHEKCLQLFKKEWGIKNVHYLSLFDRINAFELINSWKPEEQELFLPSSGMFTLCFILSHFQNENIFITGFDGFKTQHYWRDYETFFTGHNPYREQIAIKKLQKEGKINVL